MHRATKVTAHLGTAPSDPIAADTRFVPTGTETPS